MAPLRNRLLSGSAASDSAADAAVRPSADAFYRALIEQTSDLVSVVDTAGAILYVSPSYEPLLGYRPRDLLGRNGFDLVHQDDREALLDRFREAITSSGQTISEEYRLRHADGSWRTLQAIGTNLLDDPTVRGVVVNARDVTEHRRAIDLLAEQRRQLDRQLAELELLYRKAPVGLALVDLDLRFVRINDQLAAINGHSPAAHVGRSLRQIIPALAPMLEPVYRRVLDDGTPVLDLEVHGTTPAAPGVEKDWLASYYRLDDLDGRAIGVNVVVREITERKDLERALESRVLRRTRELVEANDALRQQMAERQRAEESLRQSEERYRNLVENISEALFTIDAEGRITYVSPALARMTGGWLPEEVIGHSFLEYVLPEDAAAVVESYGRALAGNSEPSEYRVRGKDGAVYWLRSHSKAVIEHGRVVSVQGMLTDVTQRRQAEMEARQQRADLAHIQRLTTAGEMTAEIAHQINQPLAAIVNFAGGLAVRLRHGHVDAETMCRISTRIADEARRASEVIRRMREFLRKGEGLPQPCDLNRLVTRVYGLLEDEFQRDGIEVRLLLRNDLPLLHVDPILIEQVVLNLLRNALEAMADGQRGHCLEVTTQVADGTACLTVRDSGVGLPAGAEARVFDAFFTTKPAGLGLGLSVSRSIIETSGGRLWAVPSDDRGTIVGFALPLAPAE